jgi:Flp pilus assembly protein TadG
MKRQGASRAWDARHRSGVASIEAALGIALVLLPLCLGVIGLGMALVTANRLDCALQAAVFYAWANPGTPTGWGSVGSASVTAARNAAVAAYGSSAPSATITVSVAFDCVSSGYLKTQPPTGYTCPAGQSVATYLTVTASTSVAPPGMPVAPAIPLSVTGTARVQ